MTRAIEVTVAAIVCRRDHFLMVEENSSGRRVFNQPSGHVETGESLLEAVVRETREETAHAFQPTGVLGIYMYRHPTTGSTSLRLAFVGTVGAQLENHPLDSSIVAVHWLSREELVQRQSLLRSPMVMQNIDDYLAGVLYPLSLLTHWHLSDPQEKLALP